jgi:hypothetical protein
VARRNDAPGVGTRPRWQYKASKFITVLLTSFCALRQGFD